MSEANTRGCDAFGAKLYVVYGPERNWWFRRLIDAMFKYRDLQQAPHDFDWRIERVTLTAKLTPKSLALALLNGDEDSFIATRERV